MTAVKQKLQSLPSGTVAISIGLGTLGLSAYLFLLLAGQVLGDADYAPLGALWILVFLLGPGFYFPIEQELGRAIAARRARGEGTAPVVKRASICAAGITMALVIGALFTAGLLNGQIFNDQIWLTVALAISLVSYSLEYIARGTFAGNGDLRSYGVLIAWEGLGRLGLAIILAVAGVATAGPYGMVVALGPFIAVAIASRGKRRLIDPGPQAEWKELSASLGNLIAASLLSQILVNSAPLVVKYVTSASEQALAGAFVKAVVITRIPLFMFQAVQAAMLPKLTHLATQGQHLTFRRAFRDVCFVVGAIGLAGTVGAFLLGDVALELFGSDYPLPRRDLTLLAAGNAVFLLCMTVAQALVAVKGQARTVFGWLAGVIVFCGLCFAPGDIVLRVEIALLAGASVSFVTMLFLLFDRLRRVEGDAEELVEAISSRHEVVDF